MATWAKTGTTGDSHGEVSLWDPDKMILGAALTLFWNGTVPDNLEDL
jgi:hypothetical protein